MRHTNDIRKIKQFCSAYTEIAAAYLFGSSATGKDRRKSDIDLAIMVNPKIGAMERVETEDWSMRPPRKSAFGRKFTPERRISTAHSCTAKSNRSPRMVDVELISRKRSRLQGYVDELKAATDITWKRAEKPFIPCGRQSIDQNERSGRD